MAELDIANLGTLPPDLYAEQQALNRQQRIAQALMNQSMQGQPQGQMVSGQYVPNSFWQNLLPVAQAAAGKYIENQGDERAITLAKQLREGRSAAEESIMKKVTGYDKATELAGPYTGSVPAPVAVKRVEPDLASALREINTNPYGAGKDLKAPIIKQMMPEPTTLEREWKAAKEQGYAGSILDFKNMMNEYQRASLKNDAARLNNERLRMADEGIIGGGGGYSGGAPMQGGQIPMARPMQGGAPVPGGAPMQPPMIPGASVAGPTAAPIAFQYDPRLTPKKNRELLAEAQTVANEGQQAKYKAAVDSADIIKQVATLLPNSTSGGLNDDIKKGKGYFNVPTKTSAQDAQLKVLGAKLVASVPRFKGADSDKDVAQYLAAAGDVANSRLPWTDRMAAVQQIYELNKKYAPDAYAGYSDAMFAAQPVERPKISDTGRILKEQFTTPQGFKRIQ